MRLILQCAIASLGMATAPLALSQGYPSAPLTIVVPFAAGSGTDGIARVIGKKLAERLKQPVLIDNRPGANAQIGALYVAKAKPDGYTLLMTTNTSHSANPSLYSSLRYDPIKDFTPITRVAECPFALAVNPGVPARTVQELVDYARAHPGKISYATPNSTSLVASETFRRMANVDIVGIPYKSSPQAMTDLVSGEVQMYISDMSSGMAMFKSGRVRVLGVTTATKNKLMPGSPAIGETLPGFDLTSWNGILGPAGMNKAVVERLNAEILSVLSEPEVLTTMAQISYEAWPSKSPDDFAQFLVAQLAQWTTLVKQAGIKPETVQ